MIRLLFIFAFAMASAPAFSFDGPDVFNKLPRLATSSVEERAIYWSGYFLETPYGKDGPLGEGAAGLFDQDPLYRFDLFDCTTFVETVTALANSKDRRGFESNMLEIRYRRGAPLYEERNHITSHSWIPENIFKGYYQDVQYLFPSRLLAKVTTLIDIGSWFEKHKLSSIKVEGATSSEKEEILKKLQALGKSHRAEEVDLVYLNIKRALKEWDVFKQNVEGVHVLNIVRPNWNLRDIIGTNLNISHQGVLIKEKEKLFFIHASSLGKVAKIPLKEYLEGIKDSKTIKGIHLLRLEE